MLPIHFSRFHRISYEAFSDHISPTNSLTEVAIFIPKIKTRHPTLIVQIYHHSNGLLWTINHMVRKRTTKEKNIMIDWFLVRLQSIPKILMGILNAGITATTFTHDRISE